MQWLVVALLAGATMVAIAALLLARWASERKVGALVAADVGRAHGSTLRSERYRLVGRPDMVRRRSDGRPIPIEIKSRDSFKDGPPRSHIIQLWAYCLLLEESEGRPPPCGILRYGDGAEYTVPWGTEERRILLDLRWEMSRPYDGRARPAPARCARCRWWAICDARAEPGRRTVARVV